VPPHARPKSLWDFAALLDRQVRNAQSSIEFTRRDDRLCGTSIDTPRATSATIRGRQVGFQFERGQDHSQKQPRPKFLIDDARVLANPSDAGIFRVQAFNQWAGVDVGAKQRTSGVRVAMNQAVGKPSTRFLARSTA
jgi:hypothetical protein